MTTTYYLDLAAGNLFGTKTTPAIPKKYYIGLSSSLPQTNGTGATEPSTSGTGYARVELTGLSEPSDGTITNSGVITFPESVTAWGTMTCYVIYDAPTGGNLLMYGNLEVSRNIESDTVLSIRANELQITLANPA